MLIECQYKFFNYLIQSALYLFKILYNIEIIVIKTKFYVC